MKGKVGLPRGSSGDLGPTMEKGAQKHTAKADGHLLLEKEV